MPKHPLKRARLMNDPRMASRRKQLMEGAIAAETSRSLPNSSVSAANRRWIGNTWQGN